MKKHNKLLDLIYDEDKYFSLPVEVTVSDLVSLGISLENPMPIVLLGQGGNYHAFFDSYQVAQIFSGSADGSSLLTNIITPYSTSISSDFELEATMMLLINLDASCIPVVDEGKVKGVLGRCALTEALCGVYREAKQQNLRLEGQLKNARDMMSFLVHDLRNPLSVCQMLCELMASKGDLNNWQKDAVRRMNSSTNQSLNMIAGLLEYLKGQEMGWRLDKKKLNLREFIMKTCQELKVYGDVTRNIKIHVLNCPDIEMAIDDQKITRVIQNLVQNAVKKSAKGCTVLLNVDMVEENDKKSLKISVLDEGSGVDEKFASQAFRKFVQGEQDEKSRTGFGLGLNIAETFVGLHGGEMSVANRSGKGVDFSFIIPTSDSDDSLQTTEAPKLKLNRMPKILLVDDDHDFLNYFQEILQMRGFEICAASNVKDGLDVFLSERPDVVISDIRMPEMDGFDFFDLIRGHNYDVPFIFLSGFYPEMSENQRMLIEESKVFLEKPVLVAKLEEELHKIVDYSA